MSELKGKEYRTYNKERESFKGFQGNGYGTDFLKTLEQLIHKNGASIIELNSVNDEKHKHFYSMLS